jgi:hypothetical protein
VTPWDSVPRVAFLGLDFWTHEFKLESNGWTVSNLSQLAGYQFPPAGDQWQPATPPFPYVTPDNVARLVYIAFLNGANHVHELSLDPSDPPLEWEYNDLTAIALQNGWNAPDVGNQPFGYVSGDKIARVVYNDSSNWFVQEEKGYSRELHLIPLTRCGGL